MSIVQFFRILWAHRVLILICTLVCFVTGAVVVNVVKPRYEASSRVMLDVIKPDPVTGQVIASAFLRAYTKSQIETVKGQQVAYMVVKELGWERDQTLQREYRERKDGMDLDFTGWAAQKVIEGAGAALISGSNILEIKYASSSPAEAKRVSDALLKAYMDLALQSRRETARRNAVWYENQAEKAKTILFAEESEKSKLERETGIILQEDSRDIDSARLAALASQGAGPVFSGGSVAPPSAGQLAILDSEIAEASKSLGPNHPGLQTMKRRRELLAAQVAAERNSASSSSGAAMSAARATAGMLEEQKAKVMAQREKVERLRLMQDGINLRRDQYNKSVARAAQLRQEAEVADAGITPLASAITPQYPVFPQKGLIIGVSIPGGAALGVLIALLLELFARRVRSSEDLGVAVDAPVLAVVRGERRPARLRWRGALPRLGRPRTAQVARA